MTDTSKILRHIRLFRSREGGHVIEYHFMNSAHKPESHSFEKGEGARAAAHLLRSTGLPHPELEEQGGSEPEPWMSQGTSRTIQIEGKPGRGTGRASQIEGKTRRFLLRSRR